MRKLFVTILIAAAPLLIAGQTRKKPPTKKPVAKPTPVAAATPATESAATPEATPDPAPEKGKRNERPTKVEKPTEKNYTPVYVYTFERPGFQYSSIRIEHDETGRGRIWFKRDGDDQSLDDPIEISTGILDRLKKAFDELHFLDSIEEYQYPGHDYSNMGNLTITANLGGRTRTVKYNWTENKQAKLLMDTYRAVSNEATWKFEMTSARENQPLLTPGLVDALDGWIRRGEIADPPHLVPYLTQISTDERLPLIARNHLVRIIKQISKDK